MNMNLEATMRKLKKNLEDFYAHTSDRICNHPPIPYEYSDSYHENLGQELDKLLEMRRDVERLLDQITKPSTPFDGLVTLTDAAACWDREESDIQEAIMDGRLEKYRECLKYGDEWVIGKEAMTREFGPQLIKERYVQDIAEAERVIKHLSSRENLAPIKLDVMTIEMAERIIKDRIEENQILTRAELRIIEMPSEIQAIKERYSKAQETTNKNDMAGTPDTPADKAAVNPFAGLLTLGEAAACWNRKESDIQEAIMDGRLTKGADCCQFGEQWVVTEAAISSLAGTPDTLADKAAAKPFAGLLTLEEAAAFWDREESAIREAIADGRLTKGVDCRKFGKQWVVAVTEMATAMFRRFGPPEIPG